jgi:hypothetical protein
LAIAIGTVVMMFSYFPYARAFAVPEGAPPAIDVGLVGVALAVAPFVFVALGFISQNSRAPRQILVAMGLLLAIGLGVGLLAPVLGAAAGFSFGGAITLARAPLYDVLRLRLIAATALTLYLFFLLVVATPAGVFAGGLLPLMALGFADEFTYWRAARAETR